jgi:hypothetical protein
MRAPALKIALWALVAALLAGALRAGFVLRAGYVHRHGTERMAVLLKGITDESDPMKNPFMNVARARTMEASMKGRPRVTTQEVRDYSVELLNAGRTSEAIALLAQMVETAKTRKIDPRSDIWFDLHRLLAVAYLRSGEEANCAMHHNARSCLFPITGTGVHALKEGSRAGVAILSEILEQRPDSLSARWLINIAYMTLGEYPDGVPSRWLLSPDLFKSDYDIGSFPDIAGDLGLDIDDLAGGSIVDDFDGDGYLDLMVSSMGLQSQLRYFHNDADGTFSDRTAAAGLTGLVGGLNIMQTDYDNDGRLDVLVLRGGWMGPGGHYPNSLLHNSGDGTFIDVTEVAGMLSLHPTQTATWFDFDGDGWLDVFIGNESKGEDVNPNELYRNNHDGTFTECAEAAGVALPGYVKGVTSGDFDDDGRPDLYVSILNSPNRLYRNDGPTASPAGGDRRSACAWRFTDVAAAAGVTEPINSFPTWFWDYDNDGREDLFVSGYYLQDAGDVAADYLGRPGNGGPPRLYRNNGDGTFTDMTRQAHLDHVLLTMGSNYGDLDNDGWLDFYAGTGNPNLATLVPNRMFRNAAGHFFQDVTTSGGFGHLQKGHGVSFADLDNDGDQDVSLVVGGAYEADRFRNALFENPGQGNHWVALKLEGVRSNRPGIGARIKVVVQTEGSERSIYKTMRSGGSFGASPLRQEIGLGTAQRILRVEIRWPAGGAAQILDDLPLDQVYRVREGEPQATPMPLRRLHLGGTR